MNAIFKIDQDNTFLEVEKNLSSFISCIIKFVIDKIVIQESDLCLIEYVRT